MAKRDNVKVNGKLELDVLLNAKNLDKQVKNLLAKLSSSQKGFGEDADKELGYARQGLKQAENLLSQRSKATKQFVDGEKKYFEFNSRQRKSIANDLEKTGVAIKNAKSAYSKLNEVSKSLEAQPKLQKELNAELTKGLAAVRKLEQTNNALVQASNPVVQKRKEQAKLAKEEVAADKKRVAAKKLDAARITQQAKERAVRKATGRRVEDITAGDVKGFSAPQKQLVQDALKGRVGLAQHRQNLANSFEKSSSAVAKTDRAVEKARAGLDSYNQLKVHAVKLSEEAARAERGIADQKKKQVQIDKANAKRDLQVAKEAQTLRDRGFATGEKDKAKATAERQKLELEGQKEVAAQNQKLDDEILARQKAAYNARKRDRKRVAREEAAEAKRQAASVQRTVDASSREKERQATARNRKAQRLVEQRALLAQRKAIAGDVFGKYGVSQSGFKGLDFKAVERQDIKSLQDYAKALQKLALQRKLAARNGGTAAQIDRTTAAYERQSKVVRQLEARYRSLNSPLQQVNLLFRQFFRFAIGYGALYGMLGAIRDLVAGVVDLDASLKSIQAITASTDSQMRKLEVTIKRVATTTKFTTTEIAAATQILGQAGVSAQELPSALQATADFAAATASNLEIAADLITTTRNVFKELDDNTLADQLTKAINISKLTAADLKTILSLSAQTAQSYNLTSEQYLAAVTTLRNAGIKASTVATGLRQGLIEIFAPDSSTIKALKERYSQLGDEITEETIKQRFFGFTKADNPLLAVLSELKRLGFADDAQKEFQRAFDVRAANAIKALIKNYDKLAEAESRITFGLSSAEAAEIQMESLSNSLSNLGAAFTVFGDAVGGNAVRGLEGFVDGATDALNALTQLDIELKKQGKDGLSSSLFPSVFGGLAGASLGKGVKNKFLLGGLGTLAGGAASLSGAATTGSTGAAVAGGTGTAVLGGLLAFLGVKDFKALKNAGAAPAQKDFFAESSLANFLGGGGGKSSKLVSKLGGAKILGLVPYIGPFIAFIFTAISVIGVINSLFSDGGSALKQADNKLRGSLADLDRLAAETDKVKNEVDEFDVKSAQAGSGTGKTASAVADLQQQFIDYEASIRRVFGGIAEGSREEFDTIMARFSDAGLSERGKLTQQLQKLTGVDGDPADVSRQAYDLSSTISSLQAKSSGLLSEINSYMIGVNEDIEASLLSNEAPDEVSKAISDLFLNSGDLRDAVLGRIQLDPNEQANLAANFLQGISDLRRDAYNALAGDRQDAASQAIESAVDRALAAGSEDGNFDIDLMLSQIVTDLDNFDGAVLENLTNIRKIVADRMEELTGQAGEESSFIRFSALSRNQESGNRDRAFIGLERILKFIDEELKVIREAREGAISGLRKESTAIVDKFVELTQSGAGRASIDSALDSASSGAAKEAVQQLLDIPNGFQNLMDQIQSEGVNTEDLNNPKFIGGLAAILKIMATASQLGNTTVASEEDLRAYTRLLPSPEDTALIENLKRQIANLGGKNKENIGVLLKDNASNPINQLRDALAREQARAIGRTIDKIEEIDPKGDGTSLDKKNVTKLNTLRVRLAKEQAALLQLDIDAEEKIRAEREKYINKQLKRRKELAAFSKKSAEEDIGIAAGSADTELFSSSIKKIDAANAELLRVFEQELIRDGIQKNSPKLFEAELAERAKLLRPMRSNFEEFSKYIAEFTSEFKSQAERLRNTPVSVGGASQDAISESFGNVGNKRRSQRAALDIGAIRLDAAAIGTERAELQTNLETQTGGDLEKTNNRLAELDSQLIGLDQSAAALNLTMMENSESAEVRAAAELAQLGNTQALIEAFQDSDHAFSNFAENLQNSITGLVSSIGDTLTDFIIDGGNFADMLGNVLHDFGRELLNQGIQTILNEMSVSLLSALPAQLVGLVPGAAGGIASEAANAVGSTVAEKGAGIVGAATEGAAAAAAVGTAVTAALAPVSLGMQVANTNLFAAGTTLNAAGLALNTAATRLFVAAIPGVKTGGVFGSSGIVRGFAGGGMISGPGTGTSDSISGVHVNGSKPMPIRVSNGESILNAKATSLLGEDFIHAMNSGKIGSFNTGAVAERGNITASGMKTPVAIPQESPTVNNQNDVNIINAIDSSSVVSAGLETPAGGRAIFNFLKANKSKVQRIIQ